jgi:siderophore synthetase component
MPFCASVTLSRQTDNLFYSVSDFHLKARPPLQCESELKMFCDLASLIHMRHLSNELTGICEDEFWNKLKSVVRNLVDKSETEVRRYKCTVILTPDYFLFAANVLQCSPPLLSCW